MGTVDQALELGANGNWNQTPMPAEIETRLRALTLIERREWPNGSLWRSVATGWCAKTNDSGACESSGRPPAPN
jgi:hypothetical protein